MPPSASWPISASGIVSAAAVTMMRSKGARSGIPENPSPATTSRYVAIYALADAGHGPASIAARLGEPIGEVEMVLAMRKRVPSAH